MREKEGGKCGRKKGKIDERKRGLKERKKGGKGRKKGERKMGTSRGIRGGGHERKGRGR